MTSIAQLTDEEIKGMNRSDLLDLIRLSRGLKARRDIPHELQACSKFQLIRFGLIVRDQCRNDLQQASPMALAVG